MPSVSPIFTSLGSNPGLRNYDILPFSPSIFFLLYIQTLFYTNMNIFITSLENKNKSRTSANNLSLNHTLRTVKLLHQKKSHFIQGSCTFFTRKLNAERLFIRCFPYSERHPAPLLLWCGVKYILETTSGWLSSK
jgi:hypothetical protein